MYYKCCRSSEKRYLTITLRQSYKEKGLERYFSFGWMEEQNEGILRAESNMNKVMMERGAL